MLSALGMFLLVFGIQEGESYDWGTITGPITVWGLIIAGVVVLAAFVVLAGRSTRASRCCRCGLFRDRNFSLSNVAITTVGFAITAMALPLMFYAQTVRGLTPTQSALLLVPMAVISGGLAPVVGKLVDRVHPQVHRRLRASLCLAGALALARPHPDARRRRSGSCCCRSRCSASPTPASGRRWPTSATRNLPLRQAGAGSGVYNTTRQIGAVLGSAGDRRAHAGPARGRAARLHRGRRQPARAQAPATVLPEALQAGFSTAMGQSLLLPAAVALLGALAVAFFAAPKKVHGWSEDSNLTQDAVAAETGPTPVPAD